MPKYIDADEFVKKNREWYCKQCEKRKGMKRGKLKFVYEIGDAPCRACDVDDMISDIEDFPAADVEQVKHGRWIQVPGKQARVCSRCEMDEPYKFADEDTNIYSWCPHCGAKMDRKADDE